MGTILRDNVKQGRRFISIRVKFMLTYISLIAVVIVVLNTYPPSISRNLVFASKQTTLQGQAAQIGTAMEGLESLTPDTVAQVMGMLETRGLTDIKIFDADSEALYTVSEPDNLQDEQSAAELVAYAISGRDAFISEFSDGAFSSGAAVPIVSKGSVAGVVYVYEYDSAQGTILLGLQSDLVKISIAMCFLAVVLSIVYAKTLTWRITSVLDAIKTVREGEYTYRIDVKGHDELAQLGDEFNSLTDRLQKIEETRRRFVADASHELKTPLAAIRLLSDSILQNEGVDEETVKEFVCDIKNEAERLTRTTGMLLDLTRLDNNIATIRSCVDCTEVAKRAVRILQPLAKAGGVVLKTDFGEGCFVLATEDDIYQIVLNLAENAIKYSKEEGAVSISLHVEAPNVVLTVDDTGIGIPAQDMPYIFDRFYRVDKARAREAGGSGLGLSIVKSTAEKHGGELRAEKKEEGGMRFIVTFPVCVSAHKGV